MAIIDFGVELRSEFSKVCFDDFCIRSVSLEHEFSVLEPLIRDLWDVVKVYKGGNEYEMNVEYYASMERAGKFFMLLAEDFDCVPIGFLSVFVAVNPMTGVTSASEHGCYLLKNCRGEGIAKHLYEAMETFLKHIGVHSLEATQRPMSYDIIDPSAYGYVDVGRLWMKIL